MARLYEDDRYSSRHDRAGLSILRLSALRFRRNRPYKNLSQLLGATAILGNSPLSIKFVFSSPNNCADFPTEYNTIRPLI